MLLDTDYPVDKIILLRKYQQQINVSARGEINFIDIPHELTYAPLVKGIFSFNREFTECYSGGEIFTDGGIFSCEFSADSTNVKLAVGNYTTSAKTLYTLIYGFIPEDVFASSKYTTDNSSEFTINTDYNYSKLVKSGGMETINQDGKLIATYTHGLGYTPTVDLWEDKESSGIAESTYSYTDELGSPVIIIDNQTLKYVAWDYQGGKKIYWRMYKDE